MTRAQRLRLSRRRKARLREKRRRFAPMGPKDPYGLPPVPLPPYPERKKPPPGTTAQQGDLMADGRIVPGYAEAGWTCEQCAEIIDPRLCIWVNPKTNGIRHAHCRPFDAKQVKLNHAISRYGQRPRIPGKIGGSALELAEVAIDLEDIQAAKAYAQVALARAVTELMEWLQTREAERTRDRKTKV